MIRRRLLVLPGITGLWQVSGRSDLSWEDSVRLDLSYVENWSWPAIWLCGGHGQGHRREFGRLLRAVRLSYPATCRPTRQADAHDRQA